jgi:hypothetical protein
MSSDLLRRAAEALRTHAERLPEPWRSRQWRTVFTDSESQDGVASCPKHESAALDAIDACDFCQVIEVWHERTAAYVALLGPPVALALADLLDAHARLWEAERDAGHRYTEVFAATELLDVARAVVREPGP